MFIQTVLSRGNCKGPVCTNEMRGRTVSALAPNSKVGIKFNYRITCQQVDSFENIKLVSIWVLRFILYQDKVVIINNSDFNCMFEEYVVNIYFT